MAAFGGIVFLVLVTVLPTFDLSLFERLFGPVGAVATVVAVTGVGSVHRARTELTILADAQWHRHRCARAPRRLFSSGSLLVHGRGIYDLPHTSLRRINATGLMRASHVDVADGPARYAVLRVPGYDTLFLAVKPKAGLGSSLASKDLTSR